MFNEFKNRKINLISLTVCASSLTFLSAYGINARADTINNNNNTVCASSENSTTNSLNTKQIVLNNKENSNSNTSTAINNSHNTKETVSGNNSNSVDNNSASMPTVNSVSDNVQHSNNYCLPKSNNDYIVQNDEDHWTADHQGYYGDNGQLVTGYQAIDGQHYFFNQQGQIQSDIQQVGDTYYYFDPKTYQQVDDAYVWSNKWHNWYMFGADGQIVTDIYKYDGTYYYFDPVTYLKVINTTININGVEYNIDSNGLVTVGINIKNLYGSHLDFVNSLIAGAIQGWKNYGILPSVTIAQAILESGWGQSYLSTAAHNLFGIKGSYNGQSIILPTQEWNGYDYVTIDDSFRRYDNNSESIIDHGYFLTVNSRYNNLHWQRDYHIVCELLQQDGYATAPTYASSLINIIDSYGLNSIDQSLF